VLNFLAIFTGAVDGWQITQLHVEVSVITSLYHQTRPLNFGRFGFLPVSKYNGNSARFGPCLPDLNMAYFHTWSLLPPHIKSPNLQQFLPVKVQTLLSCYIKSRW